MREFWLLSVPGLTGSPRSFDLGAAGGRAVALPGCEWALLSAVSSHLLIRIDRLSVQTTCPYV